MRYQNVLTLGLVSLLVVSSFVTIFPAVDGLNGGSFDSERNVQEDCRIKQNSIEKEPNDRSSNEVSSSYELSDNYTSHDPIKIDSDGELNDTARSEGWPGNGSENDPYIIEGYDINGEPEGHCIYIGNTTDHFVVRNNYLHDSSGDSGEYSRNTALYFYNIENGLAKNNTISDNIGKGILLKFSSSNVLLNNTISGNGKVGVLIKSSSSNAIFNNTVTNSRKSNIRLVSSNKIEIVNNTASNSGDSSGIKLDQSSKNNFVSKNNASSNVASGIHLNSANDNTIRDNHISGNDDHGVCINSGDNNLILNNAISNHPDSGIALTSQSNYNNIIKNNVSDTDLGIDVDSSNNNDIVNNTSSFNGHYGIVLSSSESITIKRNTLSHNDYYGLLLYGADNNKAINNTASHNGNGFYLVRSESNTMVKNTLSHNGYGISIDDESYYNQVYLNAFINNGKQAWDNTYNQWYNEDSKIGNYWNDYDEPSEGAYDNNTDGIVDSPYTDIGDGNKDEYPLMYTGDRNVFFMGPTSRMENSTGERSYNFTIVNNGEYDENYDLSVSSSNANWFVSTRDNISVAAGEMVELAVNVNIPAKAYDGDSSDIELTARSREDRSISGSISLQITVDAISPNVTLETPENDSMRTMDLVWMKWEGSDNETSIEYYEVKIDDEDWIAVGTNTSHTFYELSNGSHEVKVKAVDGASNIGMDSSEFIKDERPPTVSITSPSSGEYLSNSPITLEWTGSDEETSIDRYEIRLDDDRWTDVGKNTSHTFSGLSNTLHTAEVKAVDPLGNSEIDTVEFKVDMEPPTVSVESPPDDANITDRTVTIEWNGSDNQSGIDHYEVRLDDKEIKIVGKKTNHTFENLSTGSHSIEVTAVDNASNTVSENIDFVVEKRSVSKWGSWSTFTWLIPVLLVIVVVVASLLYIKFQNPGTRDMERDGVEETPIEEPHEESESAEETPKEF